ncbi:MAG: hypothetical protein ACU83N_10000 [Gammaproteobacteria bacterium]
MDQYLITNLAGYPMKKLFKLIIVTSILFALIGQVSADTLTDADGNSLTASDWIQMGSAFKLEMIYTDTDGNGTTGIDVPVLTQSAYAQSGKVFQGGYVESCTTDPDAGTAPDDNYDITIKKKTSGLDIFQGALLNRDTSTTESAVPLLSYEHPDDTLQLVVENQTTSGAITKIILYVGP